MWLALAQLREAELQATSYADDEGSHVAYGGNRVTLVCLLDTSTVCVAYVAYNSRTFKYVKNLLLR